MSGAAIFLMCVGVGAICFTIGLIFGWEARRVHDREEFIDAQMKKEAKP